MKKYIYSIIISFTILSSSCEKIVDLDLNSIEPRLVIDASICDDSVCKVELSLTQDYFNNDGYKHISGAKVYISDGTTEEQLTEVKSGVFESVSKGVIGKTYTLRVIVDDNEYRSTATIPQTVFIDKLYIYSLELDGKYWFTPCVAFYDPKDVENFYYYTLKINDKRMSEIFVDDDIYTDGLYNERLLPFDKEENGDEDLVYGDKVEVELHTLDKGAFTFFQSLYSIASGGGTNPLGNFSGGVLGCFKAYGVSYDIIPFITEDNVFTREL